MLPVDMLVQIPFALKLLTTFFDNTPIKLNKNNILGLHNNKKLIKYHDDGIFYALPITSFANGIERKLKKCLIYCPVGPEKKSCSPILMLLKKVGT